MTESISPDRIQLSNSESLFGLSGVSKWLIWFFVWTILGVSQAARLYFSYNYSDTTLISLGQSLVWALAEWYLWGGFSLIIVRLVKRFDLRKVNRWRDTGLHFLFGLGFGALHVFTYSLMYRPLGTIFEHSLQSSESTLWQVYTQLMISKFHVSVITYFLIALGSYALVYYRRLRREEVRLARMQAQLAQASLESLKAQLQPHFLFNCLNNIAAQIPIDHRLAERMIVHLGDLLRASLNYGARQTIPLSDELKFIEDYVTLQRFRFQDRLEFEMNIEAGARAALVPAMILLPLIENGVQHGIAPISKPGKVSLSAVIEDDKLRICISDTGPGARDEDNLFSQGIGLSNSRDRIKQLYGDRALISAGSGAHGGFKVILIFPSETDSEREESRAS